MRRYEVRAMGKNLLLPKKIGRTFKNFRHTFNGILWVMCTGASWRDVPERYGKWNTLYKCFAHWSDLGIFEKLSAESDFIEFWQHLCKSSQAADAKKGLLLQ